MKKITLRTIIYGLFYLIICKLRDYLYIKSYESGMINSSRKGEPKICLANDYSGKFHITTKKQNYI